MKLQLTITHIHDVAVDHHSWTCAVAIPTVVFYLTCFLSTWVDGLW